jgi:hypothetical protein
VCLDKRQDEPGDVSGTGDADGRGGFRRVDEPLSTWEDVCSGPQCLSPSAARNYFCFFILGTMLYATVPCTGEIGSISLFVLCFLVIIRMYGGGFSTVSSYLMFGTRYVGAIYGLLLTARSMADIFGPVLVNYIREYNVTHGVPKAQA